MDTLRETALEHLRLQPPLQEVLNLQREHVVEAHARLVEHADADEPADEGVALEEPLRVLVVELEQLTGGTADFRQDEGDTPDFALVAQAVFAGELERVSEGDGGRLSGGRTRPSARHRDGRTRKADGGPCNCKKRYGNGAQAGDQHGCIPSTKVDLEVKGSRLAVVPRGPAY
jgi:hypothetical protein